MAQSENGMQRRFAIESLRPVVENIWLKKNPEFVFSVLKLMYYECDGYEYAKNRYV
jgi:hypothetical protein